MEFVIDDSSLYLGVLLKGDNTGASIEEKILAEGFRRQDKRHITILGGSTKDLLRDILAKKDEREKIKTFEEIKNILKNFKWDFKPTKVYRIKKRGILVEVLS